MNPGDKVIHKLTGEPMTIKKLYESVSVCEIKEPIQFTNRITIDIAICSLENLEPVCVGQLTMSL